MQACERHDRDCVVVFEGATCPLCALEATLEKNAEESENELRDKSGVIDQLETDLGAANEEIESLQEQIIILEREKADAEGTRQ